jgi:hypothetical protein
MAAVSVFEALVMIGMDVAGIMADRRVMVLVDEIETRQVAPAMARVNAILYANQAQEGYRTVTENAGQWAEKGKEAAGEWAEGGKDLYGKALEAVERGADEAQKQVSDAAGSVTGAIPAPASGTGSNASSSPTSYGSRPTTYPKGTESTRGSGSSSSDSPSGPSGRTRAEGGSRAS